MNSNRLKFFLPILLVLCESAGFAQCGPTTTLFAQNNNQDGVMFDITAAVDVTVTGFAVNLGTPGPYNIEIYTKLGTHVGFENTAGAWTLVATMPGVFGAGVDVPTPLPMAITVPIALGTTSAFYITDSGTGNTLAYTAGIVTGSLMVNDGNISIFGGTGVSYAFGFATPDRGPNIVVNYQCCPAPTAVVNSNSCPGISDGSVNVTGQGTGPWSYSLLDVSGVAGGPTAPANAPFLFTGLASGNYVVTSTDVNGCIAALNVIVAPAVQMTFPPIITDNVCFGGTDGEVTINIVNGSGPYNVSWLDPFGNPLQTDNNVTSSTITGLASGSYTASVTDQSGCNQLGGAFVSQPLTGLVLNFALNQVNCFGANDGEIEAQCVGTPPYTYDLADVLGNPLATGNDAVPFTFTGLLAGTYFVTVTDALGCQIVGNTALTEPTALQVQSSQVDVLCHDGTTGVANIDLISGGTTPYGTTQWSNLQTGPSATGLAPGTYSAATLDANGCLITQTFLLDNPPAMILDARYLTDTCGQGKGTAFVNVSLGTPPYTFAWPLDPTELTYAWDSLGVGIYTVVVTDFNACIDSAHVEVKDDIQIPTAAFEYRYNETDFLTHEVLFLNNSIGSSQWTWRFGDGLSSNQEEPTHHFARAGDYLVLLSASNGYCADSAYQYVNIDPLETLYIPNAFTPGGNDKNPTFRPYGEGLDLESYDMKIYDKWGRLIWQTGNMSQVWDGNEMKSGAPVPVGTYIYEITFRDYADLDRNKVVGSVLVIRD